MNQAKREAIAVLEDIIRRQLGLIEGVRVLVDRRHSLFGHPCDDPDFATLAAFESETDHLPIGDVRRLWSPEALVIRDKEIMQLEEAARPEVLAACHAVLAKFRGAMAADDEVEES